MLESRCQERDVLVFGVTLRLASAFPFNEYSDSAGHVSFSAQIGYAASWKTEGVVRSIEEINDLGRRYAELSEGPEKEAILLEICQCFHPYLMKYLVMICRGRLPLMGIGKNPFRINQDVRPFLLYFLPKGQNPTSTNLAKVARHLHLAFKGMDAEEIYDVLMAQLVAAAHGYDPN